MGAGADPPPLFNRRNGGDIMPRFISPYAGLRLFGGPLGTVRFEDGAYQTDDPEEVRWLRSHRGFGVDFFEEGPEPKKPAPPPDPKALLAELEQAKAQLRELMQRLAAYEGQQPATGATNEPGTEQDIGNEGATAEDPAEPAATPRRGGRRR